MNKEINDGGPAFPHSIKPMTDCTYERITEGGMSLRDYIAVKAMQSFITRVKKSDYVTYKEICDDSYNMADAMIIKRKCL